MLAALIVSVIFLGLYLKDYFDYKHSVEGITISEIDIASLEDGVYSGECDVGFIRAEVAVTVRDGKIISILPLRHDN